MQFPDISASMLALKALKHENRPLTFDEVNALFDRMIELFNLRKLTKKTARIKHAENPELMERRVILPMFHCRKTD